MGMGPRSRLKQLSRAKLVLGAVARCGVLSRLRSWLRSDRQSGMRGESVAHTQIPHFLVAHHLTTLIHLRKSFAPCRIGIGLRSTAVVVVARIWLIDVPARPGVRVEVRRSAVRGPNRVVGVEVSVTCRMV